MFDLEKRRVLPVNNDKKLQVNNTDDVADWYDGDYDDCQDMHLIEQKVHLHDSLSLVYSDDIYTSGYSFFADNAQSPKGSDNILKIISEWIETCVVDGNCDGDPAELDDFLEYQECEGNTRRGLLLDRFDLVPIISVYSIDTSDTLVFNINYMLEGNEGNLDFYLEKTSFFEGKIKFVGDSLKNKDHIFDLFGKDNILSFIKFFKGIIDNINSKYKDIVFEDIVMFPFTTHNVSGVGRYLARQLDSRRVVFEDDCCNDSLQYENGKICCRYIVCLG